MYFIYKKIKKRNKPQADQSNIPKINEEMLQSIKADKNIQQKTQSQDQHNHSNIGIKASNHSEMFKISLTNPFLPNIVYNTRLKNESNIGLLDRSEMISNLHTQQNNEEILESIKADKTQSQDQHDRSNNGIEASKHSGMSKISLTNPFLPNNVYNTRLKNESDIGLLDRSEMISKLHTQQNNEEMYEEMLESIKADKNIQQKTKSQDQHDRSNIGIEASKHSEMSKISLTNPWCQYNNVSSSNNESGIRLLDSHLHSTLHPTNEDNSDQITIQNNQAPTLSFNSAFSDLTPLRPVYFSNKFTKFKSENYNLCFDISNP